MPKDLVRIDLDALYPPFTAKILQLAANCRARGADYYMTGGFRSPADQLKLWQQGRNAEGAVTDPSKIVTKLKFGLHNLGIAVDFTRDGDAGKPGLQPDWNVADYSILAEEAVKLGLEAGFNWAHFRDCPHIQIPIESKNISVTMLRGLFEKGGLPAVWGLLTANGFSAT